VEAARDPLVEESPVLAGITGASVLGQIALGPRAGARVWRLGADPDAPWITSSGPGQAHVEGFDLHASVRVPGPDRRRLEHLCRYLLRPPLGQERLRRLPDGRIAVELKRGWADGTTHLLFAPHAKWRPRIVPDPPVAGHRHRRLRTRPSPPPVALGGLDAPSLRPRRAGVSALRGPDASAGDDR
jgi:hypothetical protein